MDTPTLGQVLRKARERRGLGLRELATQAGLSPSFLTRVERDLANPTWRTIEGIAAALQAEPLLRLVADEAAVAGAAALIDHHSPLQRLLRQPVNTLFVLELFVRFGVPFVVAGSVAGLFQGLPTPVHGLQVLVKDDDEALEKLSDLLANRQLLFADVEPEELREFVQRSWDIDDCEVTITLVEELPASESISLDDVEVRVVLPQSLLADPEVAATLRISTMRSSEL
jgi:transcriptional regulator with XRE-family HTH domain